MGFFSRNANEKAFVGGKKHWIDIIKNSGPGDLLIWRQPEEDFNTNSKVVVMPGEVAIFIKEGNVENSEQVGTVEFRNVSFTYEDAKEPVLEDISFKVEKGETVAFIGSTGSGKSTLINLIPRFYDATKGQVLVDGIDVKGYKKECLNDKIGYVPQKANLFSGNITSNMMLAKKDITDEEIEKALEIAQCGFIEKLEEGYNQPGCWLPYQRRYLLSR